MKQRILIAIATLVVAALSSSFAGAHQDHNADGNNNSTRRCDTHWRKDHAKDGQGRPESHQNFNENTASSHEHTSEFDDTEIVPGTGSPNTYLAHAGLYLHRHTGHYVIRHDAFYIEVIGGGGYNRGGNQGGTVQGEVDPVAGAPDADFNAGTFAGTNGNMVDAAGCVSVADNKVGDQGSNP